MYTCKNCSQVITHKAPNGTFLGGWCGTDGWGTMCGDDGGFHTIAECPGCHAAPAYNRKLADPWDTHFVCIECSWCYSHDFEHDGHEYAR